MQSQSDLPSSSSATTPAASQPDMWRYVAFARFDVASLKRSNVVRHEQTAAHRFAMKVAGILPADSQGDDLRAPPVEVILNFWDARQNGASLVTKTPGFSNDGTKGAKNRKLEWCIAEARRMFFREFIRRAEDCSVTLAQDGRGKHLMVRAIACNSNLRTASATLGIVETHGGATNLCIATLTVLERFCTDGYGRPGVATKETKDAVLDRELLKKFCASANWRFTDAAYDEFAAGELLTTSAEARNIFPNLRVIGREKAHASRRILSRPQGAEPYLCEVCDHFVWSYDSAASLIQHNMTVKDIFKTSARSDPAASQISELRFRRHRFDSQAEPMTRMVVAFDAVLQTIAAVSHARKSEDIGKSAAAFLHWLTDEAALQMAMMADASDQVLMLVRSNDTDHPDPAEMSTFISSFLVEGARLWLEDGCWGFGCTAAMLRNLRTPRVYLIAGGEKGACTIGGRVDDACKQRCLTRMKCWFRLALDVCQAEWPYYDVLNACQVFSLGGPASGDERLQTQSLERLANTFGFQPVELESQFSRHQPLARAAHIAAPSTNLVAWKTAIDRTAKTHSQSRPNWRSDTLRRILMRYGACCASTSALERRFSKMEKIFGTRLQNQTADSLRDSMEITEPASDVSKRDTAEVAREVWDIYFGPCHKPPSAERIDKGQKRRASTTGYAAFQRKRKRNDTLRSTPGVSTPSDIQRLADSQIATAGSWTPSMQKEHEFQMRKIARSAGEAYAAGSVLQSEAHLLAEVGEEYIAKRTKRIHERRLAESRKIVALTPPAPLIFRGGEKVYVDESVGAARADVIQAIGRHSMVRVDDVVEAASPAGYIIVAMPADEPGLANRWVAVLAGCALVTADYFCSSGKAGSCMSWRAAVGTKRDVWLSAEWSRDNPLLAHIVKWAIRLPASKWKLRDAWPSATYVDKQKKQKGLVGIVSDRQKAIAAFHGLRHCFVTGEFLRFVSKLNAPVSGYVNPGTAPASSS